MVPPGKDNGEMNDRFDIEAMRARLASAIEATGKSKRRVSLDSGNGAGYVHSILGEGKIPTVEKLAEVCAAVPVSLSWVMYGVSMSPETERLIRLLEENPEKRDSVLALLSS